MSAFVIVIIWAIESAGSLQKHVWERNETMEESLLDITANSADTDCEERPVNRYGSPIARRSSGDVGVQAIGAIFCITENGADSLKHRSFTWLASLRDVLAFFWN